MEQSYMDKIRRGEPVRLSSRGSSVWAIVGSVVGVVAFLYLMNMFQQNPDIPVYVYLILIMMLGGVGFMLWMLLHNVEATLTGKRLFLKRTIGGEFDITVHQVEKISTFRMRNSRYTVITFTYHDAKHKAVITHAYNIFTGGVHANEAIEYAKTV